MNISERVEIKTFTTAMALPGVKRIEAVDAAIQRAERLTAAASGLGSGAGMLATAVAKALDAGIDPGRDEQVISIVVRSQFSDGIAASVGALVYDDVRQVLREVADEVVLAWRPVFDDSASALVAAHGVIGDLDLADSAGVLNLGPTGAGAWGSARAAIAVLDVIDAGWQAAGSVTRLRDRDQRHVALRFAESTYEQWTEHGLDRKRVTPWDCVRLGLQLRLPTFAEYHADVRAIAAGAAAAQADFERARTAHFAGRRPTPLPAA
jgi:hypothetical protein